MRCLREVVKKKRRIFYGQADRKGAGGVSHLGRDQKQMWKFWPIFLIVGGLKKAFFIPLTPLLYCYLTVLWQSSSGNKEEWEFLYLDENDFSGVKSISENI